MYSPRVLWQLLVAIAFVVCCLGYVVLTTAELAIGPLYWLACLAGGSLTGAGIKMGHIGWRGVAIGVGILAAMPSVRIRVGIFGKFHNKISG